MDKNVISTKRIVVWFLLFPLVGLVFFLMRKTATKLDVMYVDGMLWSIFGWYWTMTFTLCFIGIAIASGFLLYDLSLTAIFCFFGILIIHKGNKIRKKVRNSKKYIELITKKNISSIEHIATTVGKDYDKVLLDLEEMINKEILIGFHINQSKKEIKNTAEEQQYNRIQAQRIVVECTGCGASNTVISGQVAVCEYCDTVLRS